MKERRGQVTIFVIIALLIVSAVLIFFVWVRPSLGFSGSAGFGFEGCVSDSITGAVTALEGTAGLGDSGFTYQYNGVDIPYVCYTNNFYETCTVQQPFLLKNFESALHEMVEDDLNDCYASSLNDLRSQGYEVSAGELSFETSLEPGVIRVPIQAPTSVGSQSFTRLNVDVASPMYDMLIIATTIIQEEARIGDANIDNYRLLQPDYAILKYKRDDGTTIYTIRNKLTGNEMQFASRSLAWPAGFG